MEQEYRKFITLSLLLPLSLIIVNITFGYFPVLFFSKKLWVLQTFPKFIKEFNNKLKQSIF